MLIFLLTRHVHGDLQQAHPFHTTRCHQVRTRRYQKSEDVTKHRRKKTASWRFLGTICEDLKRVNKTKDNAICLVIARIGQCGGQFRVGYSTRASLGMGVSAE